MLLDSKIIFKNYLNRFSLSFKKKNDQLFFENETKFQTYEIIKAFIFLCLITSVFDVIMGQTEISLYFKILIIISLLCLSCILVFCVKKFLIKKKVHLEICITLLVLIEILIQIHVNIPGIFKKIHMIHEEGHKLDEVIFWTLLSYGIALDMLLTIVLINIRWIFSLLMKSSCYTYIAAKIFGDLNITALNSLNIPLFCLYVILSISASYLHEKTFKELYISLKRNQDNLKGFEKLIEKNIPNLIFILKFDEPIIMYTNSKAKEFFKTTNEENSILLKRMECVQLISDQSDQENDNKANIMTAYHKLTDRNIFRNFCDVEDDDFKSYDGVYQKYENNETRIEMEKKTFNFEIKMGAIHWKSERAILILLNDVSSKVKIKNLKEINNYKDMLLATVSHDLRTPLGAIIGFLEILSEKIMDKKLLKYISAAYKSSKILLFMINDILDFSQITNKKIKLNYEEVFIKVVLDGILDIVKYQSKKKGIKLIIEISEIVENIKVFCDSIRLQQILLNLIGNAIKFTFEGEIKLVITIDVCEKHDYSHQKVIFKISDTGIGIEGKDISKIFDLFYKVEHENSNCNKNGIGLGLFISQKLSKLMHDEGIKVRSELNKGSEFIFSIPSQIIDENFQNNEENIIVRKVKTIPLKKKIDLLQQNVISLKKKNSQLKVLLVDDDVMNILIHKNYLELYHIKYETALNGVQALQIIENNAKKNDFFALILLDCNMPILNGFQTAEKIHKLIENKIIPFVPIVALTANVTLSDIELCRNFGMEYFLAKPVSKIKFREKLMEILKIDL